MTDNGKVFTGRFGPAGSSSEVMFDRICRKNGIRHRLTDPFSPNQNGKVRWHKTMRAEFLADHDRRHATAAELQTALDAWVEQYNRERPHQSLGMRPPADRFQLAPTPGVTAEPVEPAEPVVVPTREVVRLPGVQRWVNQHGLISLGGFRYRVPIVLAGEPVEAVAADHLVRIFHRDVLVAEHVQRRKPDAGRDEDLPLRQGSRRARPPSEGMSVTRVVDSSGYVSFAGTNYRAGRRWRGRSAQVAIVAESVQISCDGHIIRVHPIRHDRTKEHGAFATPHGRPRSQDDHVKQQPELIGQAGTGT